MKHQSNQLQHQITQHIQELAAATDAALLNENMQRYLDVCAKFHQYSPNNLWLILMAYPQATQVAGYCKWKELGRYVRKGEKGIPILAPLTKRTEDDDGLAKYQILGFKVVYVFDVIQTEGAPLPEAPEWKSPEQHDQLKERLLALARERNIKVTITAQPGEVQGVSKGGEIEIDLQAGTKTLIHEIAHELMHRGANRIFSTRAEKELEAESVAYVVGRHCGLNHLNSPNYAALWGADAQAILDHMSRIRETATEIIQGLAMECVS